MEPLQPDVISKLVDALYDHLDPLSDIPGLVNMLGDESAADARGALANAHLAGLLAAALHR